VSPSKVKVVVNWPRPTNITEVRSFLRMARYYRRFVEGFSKIALPLTKMLRKDNKFTWTEDCEANDRPQVYGCCSVDQVSSHRDYRELLGLMLF